MTKYGPEKNSNSDTFHAMHNFTVLQKAIRLKIRSSRSQMFFKIGVLKNFASFTEKHPIPPVGFALITHKR